MSMFGEHARVRAAQQRMHEARHAVALPASALLARGERHPFVILGAAAAGGFLLGHSHARPSHLPGMNHLFGALLHEATTIGASFLAAHTAAQSAAEDV
ncbi:hypothetical protein [Frateuria soli]|uniref:hypothetical protein n=1 Tax=Frateuria soli TaxID=1542730 RepID=UPI001E4711C5|nr:hypothetical protein [Frateuria soli]UGB38052.1 hypothetical protein LQ771_14780 [Frateuria soli]